MEFGDVRLKASIRTRARTTVPEDLDVRAAPVQLDCWDTVAMVTSNALTNVILLENTYVPTAKAISMRILNYFLTRYCENTHF